MKTESGYVTVLSLGEGSRLYEYQTGNYDVSGWPADVAGNLLAASADDFLYNYAVGGGNAPAPTTTVGSPAPDSEVANPSGRVSISGTSTWAGDVGTINVYLQVDGSSGPWWDSVTGSWVAAPYQNRATIADANGDWNPAATGQSAGGGLEVFSSAVSGWGLADISSEQSPPSPARAASFTLLADSGADLHPSVEFVPPGGSITLSGSGFGDGESVSVSLGGRPLTTITSSSTGILGPTKATVPTNDEFGPETLVATGATSGRSTTAELYVVNNWSQYLDGATHPRPNPTTTSSRPVFPSARTVISPNRGHSIPAGR